ncbi:MAG: rRNA maturation RNase YbeY [Spirochaetes bacterium GWD1_61_31]|nr:MAG: rRNA maturation RNase YbeY [Spirochaetes bacterium GWB1_60_80]OHD28904.1 MAG: rRNA maturation RNase YbeY [Spirochaetes bacterium GWC1_61_12]OHD36773.1 MAG: rRNA maturation RNase YbeY [Spirochaetes bacterium GWD1_61_31]OHD43563.1 MAG: rRNA maturation RNase YbeY [Spirochaetes bacterium GWE1_60_18]OHD59029.1 MAG: rRNA maturation RNase YbeY [Spirochaetes bacterium GWF1_60_12]HAP43583.1 rRNA maturation RNase YbeY [Spirochaetaceae bacterium]
MNRIALDTRLPETLQALAASLAEHLVDYADWALQAMSQDGWDVSLLLVDDGFIAELNQTWRGKAGPTDVLSFEQAEWYSEIGGERRFLAGDIVIALPAVWRNATEFGVGFIQELHRVLIHGLLHLSGLDHAGNEAAEPMLQRQETILAALPDWTGWVTDLEALKVAALALHGGWST